MLVQTIGGTKRRVFVSFDTERDRPFKDFFINQGRKGDATWHVTGWSQPYVEGDKMWVTTATSHIKQAEVVVVLLGPTTAHCKPVLKEVAIAEALGKTCYQIIPYGAGSPNIIHNAGRVIRWDWEHVKRSIANVPKFGIGDRRLVSSHM